jgi:hypothetical protein
VVTGHRWSTGGIVAGYEFSQNTNIFSNDRSFTANRPGIVLYPAMHHHAAALSFHQSLTDTLTFEMDALYNKRWLRKGYSLSPDGNWDTSHYDQSGTSRSGAIAPSLKLDLGKDWHLVLAGTYGTETTTYTNAAYTGSTLYFSGGACYCNEGKSVELSADGRLFDLPGGPVKIAVGTGYRINSMRYFLSQGSPFNIDASQSSTYAYGELSIPVVSSAQSMAGIDHLNLSGALRYERYPGVGSVATPKFGIIYAPVRDVTIKGSWGSPSAHPRSTSNIRRRARRPIRLRVLAGAAILRERLLCWSAGAISISSRSVPRAGPPRWNINRIRCQGFAFRAPISRRSTRTVS